MSELVTVSAAWGLASVVSGLVLWGALSCLIASIGVLRFPDFFTRIHAASKAGSLGAGLPLLAVSLALWDTSVTIRTLATAGFVLLTAPIAAHVLGYAAYRHPEVKLSEETVIDELGGSGKLDPIEDADGEGANANAAREGEA